MFREEDNVDLGLGKTLLNLSDEADTPKPVGDLEIEIEIKSALAPKFSLLAYYVRDDGEVVTADLEIPVENCFPNPVSDNHCQLIG